MIALALLLAAGQHAGHDMPGMTMPMPRPVAKPAPKRAAKPVPPRPRRAARPAVPVMTPAEMAAMPAAAATALADPCPPEHAAMGHCQPAVPVAVRAGEPSGTDLPAGTAPPPPAPSVDYAERTFGPAMAGPRAQLYREHGGGRFAQVMTDLAEVQVRDGRDGYRWDGAAWFGGDVDRLVVKSEGRGSFGRGVDDAEVQALWSHAVGPYFNLQGGARYDVQPKPSRAYATVGVEGLAPYWFDVAAALFVSDRGDVRARAEAYYDQRITQRLILQPRAELNVGRGDVALELGLRLRYEITREFAPYVGVNADDGDTGVVLGVRGWF